MNRAFGHGRVFFQQPLPGEGLSGMRLQVAFEGERAVRVVEADDGLDLPGLVFLGMDGAGGVVVGKPVERFVVYPM